MGKMKKPAKRVDRDAAAAKKTKQDKFKQHLCSDEAAPKGLGLKSKLEPAAEVEYMGHHASLRGKRGLLAGMGSKSNSSVELHEDKRKRSK